MTINPTKFEAGGTITVVLSQREVENFRFGVAPSVSPKQITSYTPPAFDWDKVKPGDVLITPSGEHCKFIGFHPDAPAGELWPVMTTGVDRSNTHWNSQGFRRAPEHNGDAG